MNHPGRILSAFLLAGVLVLPAFAQTSAPEAAPSAPAAEDRAVFENNCSACHGNDGRAQTAQGRKMKAKDLRESRLTEAEIERQIREGSRTKTGVSVMPPIGRDMTDAQIQAAIRVVKSFRPPAPTPK
jgi:mono/diheme cytochrome c family protein